MDRTDSPLNWVLFILIALLPLQNIYIGKVPTLGAGLNLLNILILVAFFVWRSRKDLAVPTNSELNKPVIIFMGILAFSVIVRFITLGKSDTEILSKLKDMLIPTFLFFIVLNSVRDRRGIIYALAASWLPLPYMFYVFRAQLSSVMSWHYSDNLRAVKGTFMELGSNEMAAFYASYTIILLTVFCFLKDTKVRVTLFFLTIINLYCVVYSHSRGAYLSFLAAVLWVGWCYNKKLVLTLIPALLLLGAPMLTFFPVSVQERFEMIQVEEGKERDQSAASRFVFWGYAFEEFQKSPIVGRGLLTFKELNPRKMDSHNYYIRLLAEQGLVGIICFLIVLWRASKMTLALYREAKDPLYKALGLGMAGCVASLAVGNMFGDRFSHYPLISYFWIYLALVVRALYLVREDEQALVVQPILRKPISLRKGKAFVSRTVHTQ